MNHQRATGRSPFQCEAGLDVVPCLFEWTRGLMTPRRHWPAHALQPLRCAQLDRTVGREVAGRRPAMTLPRLNAEQRRESLRRSCSVLCRLDDQTGATGTRLIRAETHQMAKQPTTGYCIAQGERAHAVGVVRRRTFERLASWLPAGLELVGSTAYMPCANPRN